MVDDHAVAREGICTLLNLQKDIEAYKESRYADAEESVKQIVQKVSQEVLNKSISLEDHQKMVIDALEKAKKEGVF